MFRLAGSSSTLLVLSLLHRHAWADLTSTCASGQLDWYTSIVGETPCATYQQLRRVCNPDFKVHPFRQKIPGDQCNDGYFSCCCNSIAFQLSMLCLNCQRQNLSDSGIDAKPGTYGAYLGSCSDSQTGNMFPNNVERNVCDAQVSLGGFLFSELLDGSWSYAQTRGDAEQEQATNSTLNTCKSLSSPSDSVVPSYVIPSNTGTFNVAPQTTSTSEAGGNGGSGSEDNASKATVPAAGTVAGIVIGLVAFIGLGGFAFWYMRRQRRQTRLATQSFREKAIRSRPEIPHINVSSPRRATFLPRFLSSNSPVDTLPTPYSPGAGQVTFRPEAMMRPPQRRPRPHSRLRPTQWDAASRDDSRVAETIDESPDPHMPMEPLRLEEKEKKG